MVSLYYSNQKRVDRNLKPANIELGKIYHYSSNTLPETARTKLVKSWSSHIEYLQSQIARHKRYNSSQAEIDQYQAQVDMMLKVQFPSYPTDEDFEWVWKDEKNQSLAGRIVSWIRNTQDISIKPPTNSIISNTCSLWGDSFGDFYFTFTDDVSGHPSEFVHSGSCWWYDENKSRHQFTQNGGLGLRFYDCQGEAEYRNRPISRVWVMPYNKGYMFFNGYGRMTAKGAAEIFAASFGFKHVNSVNLYITSTYVNNCKGYYVTHDERPTQTYRFSGGRWKKPILTGDALNMTNKKLADLNLKWSWVSTGESSSGGKIVNVILERDAHLRRWRGVEIIKTFNTRTVANIRFKLSSKRTISYYKTLTNEQDQNYFIRECGRRVYSSFGGGKISETQFNRIKLLLDNAVLGIYPKHSPLYVSLYEKEKDNAVEFAF